MTDLTISRAEHRERKRELLEYAAEDGYDGVVLFGSLNIHYVSGMYHLPTERPVALGITDERVEAVVPRLEQEHASRDDFLIDEVTTYFEYPQDDPMEQVAEMCERLGLANGSIAVDSDGSPARNGYTGPSLSDLLSGDVGVEDYITDMRETKSDAEIELIREASVWANLGHRLLQERIEVGRRPIEVRAEVEAEAVKSMLDTLGDRYEMRSWANPMQCLFTTGDVTGLPHSMDQTTRIERGDNIVTIVKPNVGGYTTELERTMFVGEVSDEKRDYFEIMKESQDIAIEAIEPGVEYATVEEVVVDYYEEQGVAEYTQHHVGHNIGLEGHERPFLDVDQDGEIRPGELFTVEPGFYVPGLGGFRHSDTVLVTEEGTETLTYYPRDLESLIV
ncbi:M24 family metallopeptidase [Natronobacterium texcoconense]|uniref:Xaa-Pro aminopeptidase n=1 Tax=Natronobacterium texcoconense TaxID=1095778 RepID=A0A1H1BHR7_NATTX|nr:Xaa-Pro peptidase family protein [Natronobacterium texcoconense]SDQ51564.1 Xaa-Pro aminopeptidase [Natronobacterium texcoconense]